VLNLRQIRIDLRHPITDAGATGSVTWYRQPALRTDAPPVLYGAPPIVVQLAGAPVVAQVPPTDDPAVEPTGWNYLVVIDTDVLVDRYLVEVPTGGGTVVEFRDLLPATAATGGSTAYASLVQHLALAERVEVLEGADPPDGSGGTGGVQSIAATDATIVITGAPTTPSLRVGTVAISSVTGLTGQLGDLAADVASLTDQVAALPDLDALAEQVASLTAQMAATQPRITRTSARVTDGIGLGNPLPTTGATWQQYAGVGQLVIAAAPGDVLELAGAWMTLAESDTFYDVAAIVDDAPVWWGSSGAATPAVEGDPALYPGLRPVGFYVEMPVDEQHLDGGLVHLALMVRTINSNGKLFHSATFPFRWRVINLGG
jgi:hypothetical protein